MEIKSNIFTKSLNKKLAKLIAFLLVLSFVMSLVIVNIFADDNGKKAVLTVTEDELSVNDEFVLSIALDNTDYNLYAYTARLSYDKNVFEIVETNSFEVKDNWSSITYNKESNKFVLINKKGYVEGEDLLEISMRVKEDAIPGKTAITLQGITASNGSDVIEIENGSVEILIIRDGLLEDGTIPSNNSFIDDYENNIISVKSNKIIFIVLLIVLFITIIGFIVWFYSPFNKINATRNQRMIITSVASIISLILFVVMLFVIFTHPNSDVNNDGQIDYTDTEKIIDQFLEIHPADKVDPDFDVNGDGKVDIGDIGQSVEDVNKQDPDVTITDGNNPNNTQNKENTSENTSTETTNSGSSTQSTSGSKNTESTQNTGNTASSESTGTSEKESSESTSASSEKESDESSESISSESSTETTTSEESVSSETSENTKDTDSSESSEDFTETTTSEESVSTETSESSESTDPSEEFDYDINYSTIPYLANKGNIITIHLNITSTPKTDAEFIKVDNTLYELRKVGEDTYEADIKVPEKAGVYGLNITNVILDNGIEADTNFVVIVDVLKDIPQIADFKIDATNELANISFRIEDPDNSFINGTFIITENGEIINEVDTVNALLSIAETDKSTILYEKITDSNCVFDVRLKDGYSYHYEFIMSYKLDHDVFEDDIVFDKRVTDEVAFDNNIPFVRDYNFVGESFILTDTITSEDELILTFKNGYNSYYKVGTIVVNGREYSVNGPDIDGIYSVMLAKADTKGFNTITIESATLENDATKYYEIGKELIYLYLKETPEINAINTILEDNNLSVSLDTIDIDNAIISITFYLKNTSGNVVKEITIDKDEIANIKLDDLEEYNLCVEISYDLGDGTINKITKNFDEVIKQNIKITSIKAMLSSYINRGEVVDVFFTVEDNANYDPTHILINGVKLSLEKQGDGTYKVSFNAPKERPENGIVSYDVMRVYYNDEKVDVKSTIQYEILKTKPSISNDYINDTTLPIMIPSLQFDLTDEDNAFISGRIIVIKEDDPDTKYIFNYDNKSDNNIVVKLNGLKQFTKYILQIEATYDLDNNIDNNENTYTTILKEYNIEIMKDYNFSISDFMLKEITNDVVTLEFTSTNDSNYLIQTVVINGKEYSVNYGNNIYTVDINTDDFNKERTILKLEKVTLENLKAFTDEFTNLEKILVFKTQPSAVVTGVIVDNDKTNVTVNFDIIDSDNTINSSYVVLKKGDEIIAFAQITANNVVELKPENNGMIEAGDYTVEIISSFNLIDGLEHISENITAIPRTITVDKLVVVDDISSNTTYVEKLSDITFKFIANSNTIENITDVEINNNKYPVEKIGNSTYNVTVKAADVYGNKQFKITNAYFNEEKIDVLSSTDVNVYVLKDRPYINNGFVDTSTGSPILHFDLNDPDNAFISGKIIAKNSEETLEYEFVKNDTQTIEILLEGISENSIYNVTTFVSYDLDDNNDDINKYYDQILTESSFELINNYNFKIKDFELISMDEEYITLQFVSTNSSNYGVSKVTINGNIYDVQRNDEEYLVIIPVSDFEATRTVLQIEKVILENLKAFDEPNNLNGVVIFKNAPTAVIASAIISDDNTQIDITYNIEDLDGAIVDAHAILQDSTGTIYQRAPINVNENDIVIVPTDSTFFNSGAYTVKIVATCDRADGLHVVDQDITKSGYIIFINKKVEVTDINIDKYYYEQNEELELTFKVSSNTNESIKHIKLTTEDTLYTPEYLGDGIYKVTINTKTEPGIISYGVSRIDYTDESISFDYPITKDIEILKKEPILDTNSIKIDDTLEVPVLSFNIIDENNALKFGKVFVKHDGIIIKEYDFDINNPEIVLDGLKEFVAYSLDIEITYDLDSNKEDNTNIYTKILDRNNTFEIMTHYNFNITDYKVISVDDKIITLEFISTNDSEYKVQSVKINDNLYSVINIEENTYRVEIPISDVHGVKTDLNLTEALLVNLKSFDVNINPATVFLNTPEVSTISGIRTENGIDIEFKLTDDDNTVSNVYVTLISERNEISVEKIATKIGDIYKTSFVVSDADTYDTIITADYERLDGKSHIKEQLYKKTNIAKIEVKADITEINIPDYVSKNNQADLTFKVESNTTFDVIGVVLNGEVVNDLVKTKEGLYTITVNTLDTYGNKTYEITELIFENEDFVVITEAKVNTYVLKDAPVISKYEFNDSLDVPEITILVDDPDDTLLTDTITVIISDSNGKEIRKENVNVGKESIIKSEGLLHEYKEKYILTIDGLYDLDDVKNNETNESTHTFNIKDILGEREIELLDYEVHFESITVNSVNTADNTVTISFSISNNTEQNIYEVIVKDTYFVVEGPDESGNYIATVPYTPNNNSKVTVTLEGVKLNNGRVVAEPEDVKDFTIFLDAPKVTISNEAAAENMASISANIKVTDSDDTIIKLYTVLRNEFGDEVSRKEISKSDTNITISVEAAGLYTVDIVADYERFDGKSHTDEILTTSKQIEIKSTDVLELKNIVSMTLYNGLDKIDMLDIRNGIPERSDLSNYYVKVEMQNLPTFYADVEKIELEDKKLIVKLDESIFLGYIESENDIDELSFEIAYLDNDGEHKLFGSAKDFFAEVSKNLYGTYVLTEDLDASDITGNLPIINGSFRGTLDGNGHKIVGLNVSLFSNVYNATIKNLIIEDAHIIANQNMRGIIATTTSWDTKVDNVHIINSSIEETSSAIVEKIGGFFGEMWETTTVRNSSAINIKVQSDTQAGGIVGCMYYSGVRVENCYVTGTIIATYNNTNIGSRAGGIAGVLNTGYIDKCYANVKVTVANSINAGGLVGQVTNSNSRITNSFAINTGNGRKVIGFDVPNSQLVNNIWETSLDNAVSNINSTGKVQLANDLFTKDFFKNTLGFDETKWNLDLLSINELPNLLSDPTPNDRESYVVIKNVNDIPNYDEVRANSNYRADREIAYYNMSKIAPFATVDRWLEVANNFTDTNLINEKIAMILAFDKAGNLVVGLQSEDVQNITNIRLFYENGKSDSYNVTYLRTMGGLVAEYEIKNMTFKYQFDSYIVDLDDAFVEKLVGWAKSYDYEKDIASTTTETESRLYVDYYNESVKENVRDIVINYLLTYTDYPIYASNPAIKEQFENSITEETIKKLLYAYNYYDKWYDINLESVSLSDLLFFKGTIFNEELTTKYLINSLYNTTSANRDTNATYSYYNSALQPKTGKSFIEFLEYTFRVLDGYENYNEWFIDHFDGIIVEVPSFSENADEITYRVWDLMSSNAVGDRRRNILPILTAPQEDMYILSLPSQILIGSLNRYNDWINGGENREELMIARVKNLGEQLSHLYGTMANLIPDSPQILNNHMHFQYDSRFGFPQSGQITQGTQDKGLTQDPVVKWVFEAINQLAAANGSGAYANGTDVWWVCYAALDGGDFTYFVFAHETAHNQDGYYFYDGNGRRVGTGPESHADDNYGMATGDNSIMFNVFRKYDFSADISNNFSYERIDSPEEIKDFYFDIFETKYAIDYMMGQAFLNLTPEEQAKVVVQVSHTPDNKTFRTNYNRISAEELRAMNLNSIEDLMDNKLAMHAVESVNSATAGGYGEDSFYNVYWYQPFNDNGAPDAYVFRRNAKEMLGIGGYMNGYVAFMSGNRTDLDALRIATGDPDITWKEYKMDRFNRVSEQLEDIPYFDYEDIIKQFENALRADGKAGNLNESINMQKVIYGLVKRSTNDFTDGTFFEAPTAVAQIHTANELIELMNTNSYGNFELVDNIDFTGILPAGESYYISNTFIGVLDGNGYTISGLQYPLFNNVAYAQFKNIIISAEKFNTTATAYLAKTAKRSTINTVKVASAEMQLPYFAAKNVCYEYGNNSMVVAVHEIDSIDDFIAIGSSAENLKKRYIITEDLDFRNYVANTTSIIMGAFSGELDGNGRTISGLNNASLFSNFQGTVKNIIIRDFTNNRNADSTGAFAATSSNATFTNMYFDNIALTGYHRTGILSGNDQSNSIMENITIVNSNVKGTGYYAALLVGRKFGGRISNCYVEGKLNINSTQVAPITGELLNNALTENTVANVEVTRRSNDDTRNMSAGFIGSLYNNSNVRNSIALGNMMATPDGLSIPWRFTSSDASMINSKVSNSYELAGTTGNTSIRDNVTTIKEATDEQIHTVSFWRDTLGLSAELWRFDGVESTGHPQLIHDGIIIPK